MLYTRLSARSSAMFSLSSISRAKLRSRESVGPAGDSRPLKDRRPMVKKRLRPIRPQGRRILTTPCVNATDLPQLAASCGGFLLGPITSPASHPLFFRPPRPPHIRRTHILRLTPIPCTNGRGRSDAHPPELQALTRHPYAAPVIKTK